MPRLVKSLGLPSRLRLLSTSTIIAAPLAVGTLYFPPPGAFGCLILYYFFAETWFAVLFTVIVEIVDPEVSPYINLKNVLHHFCQVRSTCIAIFLFLMNLVGGNLPVIVSPLRSYFNDFRRFICFGFLFLLIFHFSLRSALYLVWHGFLSISAAIFLESLPLWIREKKANKQYDVNK